MSRLKPAQLKEIGQEFGLLLEYRGKGNNITATKDGERVLTIRYEKRGSRITDELDDREYRWYPRPWTAKTKPSWHKHSRRASSTLREVLSVAVGSIGWVEEPLFDIDEFEREEVEDAFEVRTRTPGKKTA